MARVPRRRARRARRDDRDRGRRRRAERDRDGGRGRRPVRPARSCTSCAVASGAARTRSWCFLLADPTTPEGEARHARRCATSTDGFELAERDLEIRGAGEVFGERQSGWSDLKLGRLPRDEPVVIEARARRRADPRRRSRPRAPRAAARRGRGPARRRRRVPVQELIARAMARGLCTSSPARRGGVAARRPRAAARPTTERVREAMFSTLGDVRPAHVGARPLRGERRARDRGAVARRGARRARRRRPRVAVDACDANLAATGFADRARVVRVDRRAVPRPPAAGRGAVRPRVRRPARTATQASDLSEVVARSARPGWVAPARTRRGRAAARAPGGRRADRLARSGGSAGTAIRSSSS